MQKFEYLDNENSFLDETKNIVFIVFIILVKNKNFIKNIGHKLELNLKIQ